LESSKLLLQPTSKPLKLLSTTDSHLVISIQSTKQIRNRYLLKNHAKPSFFLLYKPFNQSINLTKNASNPYPARFLAFNLKTIVSSLTPFNIFPFFRLPKIPSNQRFSESETPILVILSLYNNKMVLCYIDKSRILYIFMFFY
jgi:hypothetical protein